MGCLPRPNDCTDVVGFLSKPSVIGTCDFVLATTLFNSKKTLDLVPLSPLVSLVLLFIPSTPSTTVTVVPLVPVFISHA